ncbi:MAG TPA: flagellar basal body rod protein FlgB [Pseudolabrys sp.]|jgi:flagellar basal-body rod protein FlgB|nr:flagellar basal body rod protein FlgB [Pseudolabrys sp.]
MGLTDIPIFSMLRTRLEWAQTRQRVLAENVANSDTPNFRPRDLAPPKLDGSSTGPTPVRLATTESGHIPGIGGAGETFRTERRGAYDLRPAGNAVNIEDEMMKVAANQMDYQAVTALYTRSLNLLKTAIGKVG